jgi:hypothetical protein
MRFMRPILLAVVCIGCGSAGPFEYVPVSGQVTYEDGSPIPAGVRLIFVSQDAVPVGTAHPRPGMANTDDGGRFDNVTSYKYGDGLVPGKHKVVIQGTASEGKLVVPKAYTTSEETPLVIDTADAPLQITVPRP